MPKFLPPHKSGAHRVAAIALFRALLTQCRRLPVEAQQSNELQNIIRNRFKQHRHNTSHRQLNVCFTAGYEAIDYLDDAVAGDEESKSRVLDLLQRTPDTAKRPPERVITTAMKEAERKEKNRAAREEYEAYPKLDLFARPLPQEMLSGKRHVPILFNANHIPVLRLKKPQPHSLSVYINSRVVQRQKRHDLRHKLEEELSLAKSEDDWDAIVSGQTRAYGRTSLDTEGKSIKEPLWLQEPRAALSQVQQLLDREREKNRVMAQKMQAVVDREQEAFDREEREAAIAKGKESAIANEKPKKRRDSVPPKKPVKTAVEEIASLL
ncbi:hypothetical protein CLAFUW4_00269 [Fulvia fulva]|uniref:Complex 1 LYR protein domain-containing protein n=1 Tax=Passalora fulva TaxID=5499 RepID=A0A9Q8L5X9_PASFU|nr:uncharacterized protein CLAFUR5_00271 [Fulvia fulva]KAK4634262.1 hypothetical protein CLAFUR4_00269 [Fulvia fulva]KAK4638400.1 hypothetical protein CLAFUR0_00270 [Fulvia fulva]UJO11480.1 hypothetical protein CLAFUR5_00271 [Fulvia fulva]WPV08309.1 hypothetical protein CLAFUW4_00269 [Fulvia fulva]WPV23959.1 hypothetical protein CLAFUW7_00273 [Fulvia fulva]